MGISINSDGKAVNAAAYTGRGITATRNATVRALMNVCMVTVRLDMAYLELAYLDMAY